MPASSMPCPLHLASQPERPLSTVALPVKLVAHAGRPTIRARPNTLVKNRCMLKFPCSGFPPEASALNLPETGRAVLARCAARVVGPDPARYAAGGPAAEQDVAGDFLPLGAHYGRPD